MIQITFPDKEFIGDLGALIYPSAQSAGSIALRRFVAGENEFELTDELKAGLEARINAFFLSRSMELVANFQSLPLWKNFKYMVALINSSAQNGFKELYSDSIVGVLLAFKISTKIGPMTLYQVIGIEDDYRGNGHLKGLMHVAKGTDLQLAHKSPHSKKANPLSALRTSSPEADAKYSRYSDYRVPTNIGNNGHGDCAYVVHFFGPKDLHKEEQMKEVAYQIASTHPIFRKLETYEKLHRIIKKTQNRFG